MLFHLQRLDAQRSDSRFFNFWKTKCRKKRLHFFSQNLRFYAVVVLCYYFMETDSKIIFWRSLRYWQLNFQQNDVSINHLGQKLWEKMYFLPPKVNFSGEGKMHQNTWIWAMCKIYNVNNNKNCWYMFLLLHWWNNIEMCQKNKFHPPHG